MTKQRHAGDADSGFIGSMVGSEVSGQPSARQQQQQTLRLRQSDSGSERYLEFGSLTVVGNTENKYYCSLWSLMFWRKKMNPVMIFKSNFAMGGQDL